MSSSREIEPITQRVDGFDALKHVCDAVVALFGPDCEAVLHDFSDLEHSIVYVAGNVTDRSVGGPLTDLGVQTLIRDSGENDILSYYSRSPQGALMKSVSVILRDEAQRQPIGSLCLNLNIDALQDLRTFLNSVLSMPDAAPVRERYPTDARSAIQGMVDDILEEKHWILPDLDREQAIEMVSLLSDRGAFSYRSGPTIVGELLGLSRFTIYKYLKQIRTVQTDEP